MKKGLIVAIDGPAGSGKSTIARLLAKELDYIYIDTGAMYRALTLKALNRKIDLKDKEALVKLAGETEIDFKNDKDRSLKIFLDGKDVTQEIREPEVTKNVSYLADIPDLRSIMVEKQRFFGKEGSVVIEGRDTTTVVFPEADKKFYLDALFKERVKRRYNQLISEGKKISIEELEKSIKMRDVKDTKRKVGALRKAKDAFFLDTTKLAIPRVVKELLCQIK